MREIHYYVAISINGFIESHVSNTDLFLDKGDHAEAYLKDLEKYSDVLLGKNTYECGFQFGLPPGQKAYPWMDHYLISNSLDTNAYGESISIIKTKDIESCINTLRFKNDPKHIYLCGGGKLAGYLWDRNWIDRLILKVNPILITKGISLFEGFDVESKLQLVHSKQYESGVMLLEYQKK
ncbi:dihydrofolate reductase family protein [Leptospira sp. WS39.C2]